MNKLNGQMKSGEIGKINKMENEKMKNKKRKHGNLNGN